MLATGETHSVPSLVEAPFRRGGKEIISEGKGVDEVGRERRGNQALIRYTSFISVPSWWRNCMDGKENLTPIAGSLRARRGS